MQVKKLVAGSAIALAMTGGGLALAGTASADNGPSTPGSTATVNTTKVSALNGNKIASGNLNGLRVLNGNTVKVASGNTIVVKVSILDGALSNNIVNTGANSFNTSKTTTVVKTTTINSYNSVPQPPKHH